jgi:hypothetical protein
MVNMRSYLVWVIAIAGVLTQLGTAQAVCTVKGNLYYKDGVTVIPGTPGDTVTVKVFDSAGTEITGKVTYPTASSYTLKLDPVADIAPADKALTLKYFLNNNTTPDRVVEGVNGRSLRTLTIDIGMLKAPTTQGTRSVTETITGKWVYNDNVTGMLAKTSPAIQVFFNDGAGTTQLPSAKISLSLPNYTITIAPTDIPAGATDLTITIKFLVNSGTLDRTMSGILANDGRVQTIDVSATIPVPQ